MWSVVSVYPYPSVQRDPDLSGAVYLRYTGSGQDFFLFHLLEVAEKRPVVEEMMSATGVDDHVIGLLSTDLSDCRSILILRYEPVEVGRILRSLRSL